MGISPSLPAWLPPDMNDSGVGLGSDEVASLQSALALDRAEIRRLIADKKSLLHAHASEIEELTRQLNIALRSRPCTSDVSSESVILLLERLLAGKRIVSEAQYQLFTQWAGEDGPFGGHRGSWPRG